MHGNLFSEGCVDLGGRVPEGFEDLVVKGFFLSAHFRSGSADKDRLWIFRKLLFEKAMNRPFKGTAEGFGWTGIKNGIEVGHSITGGDILEKLVEFIRIFDGDGLKKIGRHSPARLD